MSGHLLFQNRGELPLWGIRLLGLSVKSEDKIGRFGTGLKEAIAQMVRGGLSPIIFSGDCRIDFGVVDVDSMGHPEICFRLSRPMGRYKEDEWHPTNLHSNFGQHDWNDEWMALREIACNAIDASGVEDFVHTVTHDEPKGVRGSTRVYVPATPRMLRAYAQLGDRLLMISPREELLEVPVAAAVVLKKQEAGPAQIFHRGVWVQSVGTVDSIYDYALNTLKLNESRSADVYSINNYIAACIVRASKPMAFNMLQRFLKSSEACHEISLMHICRYIANVGEGEGWYRAFFELFGENAVICPNERTIVNSILNKGKYKPVLCSNESLGAMLAACGVPDHRSVLTEEETESEIISDPDVSLQEEFDCLLNKFYNNFTLTYAMERPKLKLFESAVRNRLGYYKNGVCYLNKKIIGSQEQRVTMIEEICHHFSGAPDESRSFQNYLLSVINELM